MSVHNLPSTEETVLEEKTVKEKTHQPEAIYTPAQAMDRFKDYEIIEQLSSSGSEADIFKVRKNGSYYILKLYRYGSTPNIEALQKVREISDQHPDKIIRIYESDFSENLNRYYEVLEYAQEGSLKDLFQGNPMADPELLRDVIKTIAEGLSVLHANGLLHLDLKPSNILVRSKVPLKLVFSDFGISSLIDNELSRKMTLNLKGTPLYWSPEAFTQIVGKESDYWSLGIIILEQITGKHPFHGLNMRVIMYTLSTRGISIPESIDTNFKLLLMGLLTRNPRKRWGYNEVIKWLSGDDSVPVYFDYGSDEREFNEAFPFRGDKYRNLEELCHAFIRDEASWEEGREHLVHGNVIEWLKRNGDYENSLKMEQLRKNSRNDPDRALFQAVLNFVMGMGFIVYGKMVTFQNLYLYAYKMLRGEASEGEQFLVRSVISGKLQDFYSLYLNSTGKSDSEDELYSLLLLLRSQVIWTGMEDENLYSLIRVFDFWWDHTKFVFPKECTTAEKLYFLKNYCDLIMSKAEYENLLALYYLPKEITDGLESSDVTDTIRCLEALKKLQRNPGLMERTEFSKSIYYIPQYKQEMRKRINKKNSLVSNKLSHIENSLFAESLTTRKLEKLKYYVTALQCGDFIWSSKDTEIILALYDIVEKRVNKRKYFLYSLIFGMAFVTVIGVCMNILWSMTRAAYMSSAGFTGNFKEIYFDASMLYIALAMGLISGLFFGIHSKGGLHLRFRPFSVGFGLGSSVTVTIIVILIILLPSHGSLIIPFAGLVFGSFCYLPWYTYFSEVDYSRVYDIHRGRINRIIEGRYPD